MTRRIGLLATGLGTVLAGAAAAVLVSGAGFAATSARPAVSGTEHFSLMTTQRSASKYVIIASGVFTAGGVDVSGNTTDVAHLTGGSFKIHHGGAPKLIKESFNSKTCLAFFEASTKFTLGGGKGAYKGIHGSGKATITQVGIAPRTKNGACNLNANPLVNEETIKATAKIKL